MITAKTPEEIIKDLQKIINANKISWNEMSAIEHAIKCLKSYHASIQHRVGEASTAELIHKGIEFAKTLKADNESYVSGAGFGYSCGYQTAMEQYKNQSAVSVGEAVEFADIDAMLKWADDSGWVWNDRAWHRDGFRSRFTAQLYKLFKHSNQ